MQRFIGAFFLLPVIATMLIALPSYASPFVNETLHPELAGLRPVATAQASVQPSEPLSELVLSFATPTTPLPDAPAVLADAHTDVWERIRAGFGVQDLPEKELAEAQEWYAKRPELVTNILQRSRYYLFHIVDEVRKRGMPTEIALLPFVESGFNPRARSSAQALGLWQFIPETGAKYNLDQSAHYDARRDIIASTTAALDYLQFLHGLFEDWQLAFAAYNWGEKAVAAAIERNLARGLPTNFVSLALPKETRNYLPKLMAVKRLVMLPGKFGVTLPTIENRAYFASVSVPSGVNLKEVARLADIESGEFDILNAAYAQHPASSASSMRAIVPVGKVTAFLETIQQLFQKKNKTASAIRAADVGGIRHAGAQLR